MMHLAGFSVDVEDGISLVMRDVFKSPIAQTGRVVECTSQILDTLDFLDVKGTFFTLGIVAKDFPELIRDIVARGHELAVHGHNHYRFYDMTVEQARTELITARKVLEDTSGREVKGHRAPAFSVSRNTPWVFDLLIECGFSYDSSIMPIKSQFNGWDGFPQDITMVKTKSGSIVEFPVSVMNFLGRDIPFSGGGYFRMLPLAVSKRMYRKRLKTSPTVLYMHPYEVDTEKYPSYYFEHLSKMPLSVRIKLKSNFLFRNQTLSKIKSLAKEIEFTTMAEVIDSHLKQEKVNDFCL